MTAATARRAPAWLRPRPVDHPRVRLVVFPHAGGSAAGYRPLAHCLPTDWDVLLFDLPGHGQRHAQPCLESMPEVLLCALTDMRAWVFGAPLALFGHSFGAVVAYEVALALHDLGQPPAWLGVSGRVAPDASAVGLGRLAGLDDRALTAELLALGGLPPVLTEAPELLDRILDPVRADLRALGGYQPRRERARLRCPVTVFGGRADPLAPVAGLPAWREQTTGAFSLRLFEGGHFDLLGAGIGELAAEVSAAVVPLRPAAVRLR